MEIIAGPLDWTSLDEQRWSEFLQTETGKRFLPRLVENTPALLAAGDLNAILIRSGEVRGWTECARQILAMAQATPKPVNDVANSYPPLESDAQWNDGQKLTPAPKEQKE